MHKTVEERLQEHKELTDAIEEKLQARGVSATTARPRYRRGRLDRIVVRRYNQRTQASGEGRVPSA